VQHGNLMLIISLLVEGNRLFGLVSYARWSRQMMADDRIFWQVSNTGRGSEIIGRIIQGIGSAKPWDTALDSGLRAKRSV
jgi:hypothetical protein